MGLDVYLKKCPDIAAADAAEAEFEKRTEGVWADAVTKEDRDAKLQAVANELGTDTWGTHASRESVEINSTIDPENMFKIGYFRSSYNEGGINSVLRNLGLPDLYAIMGADNDGNDFAPDWEASLERVNDVIARYEQHLSGAMGKYSVRTVRPMWEFGVKDEAGALALFQEQLDNQAKFSSGMTHYSNRDGEFMLTGMKVVGVVTKQFTPTGNSNPLDALLNSPSVFLIYEKESDGKPDWYLTALKIVRETCEYVIAQPDRQNYYMVWSG